MNSELRTYMALGLAASGALIGALDFSFQSWANSDIQNLWQYFVNRMSEYFDNFPTTWGAIYGYVWSYESAMVYRFEENLCRPRWNSILITQAPGFFSLSFGNACNRWCTTIQFIGGDLNPAQQVDRGVKNIVQYFKQ